MAIGGLTGNAGFSSRSSQSAIGGGNPDRGNSRRKKALGPPSSLTNRPQPDNRSSLQRGIESMLPSGDSPGMALGMMPALGNFLRKAATRAGLSVGPSTPGLGPSGLTGTGAGGDEETNRLLGQPALPAGDTPVSETTEVEEQTNLAPSRTRISLPNVRRRRLSSATFLG